MDPEQYQDPENEKGLFSGMVYEADDEEADRIYEAIDAKMDEKRRVKREAKEKEEEEKFRLSRPTIQEQLAPYKRGLAEVTDEQWENLPEVNNLIGNRVKKPRLEGRSYVVPDHILVGARDANALESTLDSQQMALGLETPANAMTDFAEIGQAREKMLSIKLEQMTDSVSGSSTIDPKGYLSGLNSQVLKTDAEIGDIKRARALLQSLIKTNPKHAPGWVAAAWLENVAGKSVAARKIIAQGCEHCAKNEDVWIAASELNTNENAKIILANAVQELPQSVRIWMRAVELEGEQKAKKRVLRKALEYIPASIKLWKETVKLEENPEDARILLSRAVEVIPHSQELWLTLARLETPTAAESVLNKARKMIPTSHEIWIAAARLSEQQGKPGEMIDMIISKGLMALKKNGVELSREIWLAEVEKAELQGSLLTSGAIIKAALHLDVEEEDRMDVWLDDAVSMEAKGLISAARGVYAYCLRVFPMKQAIWRKAAELEKAHGTKDALMSLLDRAVASVPQAEILWLMAAKEAWLSNDVPSSRAILARAFEANPESEGIWLAAIKLEAENGMIDRGRLLMERARNEAATERIWLKSAVFEQQHGTPDSTLSTIKLGLARYPTCAKLYLMQGQFYLSASPPSPSLARDAYTIGTKKCPTSVPLWIALSRLEESEGKRIKSRAVLEKARHLNGKSEEIWLESVKVEERDGSGGSKGMLARALQTLPTSGSLSSHSVMSEPRPTRKSRSVDALKKTNNAVEVIITVARLFWSERKVDKARDWFGRAVVANGDFGDAWGWWYKFEKNHGNKEQIASLLEKCIAADPHHGPTWQTISKDPKNSGKSIEQVLALVGDKLTAEEAK